MHDNLPMGDRKIAQLLSNPLTEAGAVFHSLSTPSVKIVTGEEPRPDSALVFWIGGTQKPLNMVNGDLWFSLSSNTPPPDPTPVPTGTKHSIWGSSPYPWTLVKATGEPVTVANSFYSYGSSPDVSAWRVVGAKLYIPEGTTVSGSFTFSAWFGVDALISATPNTSKTVSGLVTGWNEVIFDTVVETNPGDQVFVGYRSHDGHLLSVLPSSSDGFVSALDGSHIVLSAANEKRGQFKYDSGSATVGGSVYGIDVIYDEGPQ